MPSVETLYQQSVRPLPVRDQIRLAEIIMEHVALDPRTAGGRTSAKKLLDGLKAAKNGRSSSEIDEYLRTERDSWDI